MDNEYWTISVGEALDEAGIDASTEQVNRLAKSMKMIADCEAETSGHYVISSNFNSDQQTKIKALEDSLQAEKEKVPCPKCEGKSAPTFNGQIEPARYTCYHCNQSGKVNAGYGRN